VSGEVGAGIDHLRVEEEAVEVIADIIMELDEVLVAPPAAITPHAVVAGGVPGRQGVALALASPQQKGHGFARDQPAVQRPLQMHRASVVPAIGRLQRAAALDLQVPRGEKLEQGHQAGLENQPPHGPRSRHHDLDVVPSPRP